MTAKGRTSSSSARLRIAIAGAAGRMGQAVITALHRSSAACLSGAIVSPGSSLIGKDAGVLVGLAPIGVLLCDQVDYVLQTADLLIDFTTPMATMRYLKACVRQCKPMVIGTTGFNAVQSAEIQQAAQKIAMVWSANFSLGMNLFYRLLAQATQIIGKQSDVSIIEMHHKRKADAPSGSALKMAEIIAQEQGWEFPECIQSAEHGYRPNTITLSAVRGGDIIGEHRVLFTAFGERLELIHTASSRLPFAEGALQAAICLQRQPPALYTLQDLLQL